tara:strand:- start:915 stop:1295 length:381 start_codon:yes stop_codon:yes gene_type:complete
MKTKSSVKSFGILFFIVFLLIGVWPLLNDNNLRIWSLVLSAIFLILGLIESKILIPLNKYWVKFGQLLGKIIAPIVMAIIFFLVLTPISLMLKIFKKDVLRLAFSKKIESYWIQRDKDLGSMDRQF